MGYKIEVMMTPIICDNPEEPYFWTIRSCSSNGWCTYTAGWAATPAKAWNEAQAFYNKYIY